MICSPAISNILYSTWRDLLPMWVETSQFLQPLWHLVTPSLWHGQLPEHSSRPCECLPPGWLLGPFDHS